MAVPFAAVQTSLPKDVRVRRVLQGEFVRIPGDGADGKNINISYDWRGIETIRTCGSEE